MSLGYFLADYIVLVHTRALGGTYPILLHHTMAVSAYLIGLVCILYILLKYVKVGFNRQLMVNSTLA